jgi:hypothetical protein
MWGPLGSELRGAIDYLRYLTPAYRNAPRLRERAARAAPRAIVEMTRRGPFSTSGGRAVLAASYRLLERSLPVSLEIDTFLAAQQPDVLLVTPLIEPGSPQWEYVRAARARRIRTVLCVASWDNLTNKGLIHGPLDLVTVWNDDMKREAVELHGVPPDRVAVTGAQVFDHWFNWQPGTSREAFCAKVGLRSDRPYLLYLCSSKFIAPDETRFVRRWVQALRESASPALQEVGVLVRPHPQHNEQWERFNPRGLANFTIYPAAGAAPVDAASKVDYFDSIYHSQAVVGVNTTAEIESAIVGRRVFGVLAPEFRDTQEGTLHFHHLRRSGGGLVHVAESLPDHLAQLDAALRDDGAGDDRCRRFVEAFVRPFGIDVPATPKLVEAIEAVPSRPVASGWTPPIIAGMLRQLMSGRAATLQREEHLAVERKLVSLATKRRKGKERRKNEYRQQARLAAEVEAKEAAGSE